MILNDRYRYVKFVNLDDEWVCFAGHSFSKIGEIGYTYREGYVFIPAMDFLSSFWTRDALLEIVDFIQQLTAERGKELTG